MIRVKSALTAVFVAAAAALAVSVFVVSVGAAPQAPGGESPSEAQYGGKDGSETRSDKGYYKFYHRWTDDLSEEAPSESAGGTLSEGSNPVARAPAKKLEIMEPPTPYSQVIDNATPGRFYSAQPWKKSDGRSSGYGKDFRHTIPGKAGAPAWFKVKIPTSGYYTVYT